jgi:hypothetical protein
VTLTNFTGTGSGSVNSMVATFSGGIVGSANLSTTLIDTTTAPLVFSSLLTTGDSGAQHTDATPDDPTSTGDGVFYIRVKGMSGSMTVNVQTDVGSSQTVTLSPDPNNPNTLISGKLLIIPQSSSGPTSYSNLTTFQTDKEGNIGDTASSSYDVLGIYNGNNVPMTFYQLNGGMFIGQGFCNSKADYQALAQVNASQADEIINNPSDVQTQADPNLKLNGCEVLAKSLSSDQFKAVIPFYKMMYALGHGWLEFPYPSADNPTAIPFNGIGFTGSSYAVTPAMVATANTVNGVQHKYKLVFLNCCQSANTSNTSSVSIPGISTPFTNQVQNMYQNFNTDAYIGWSDTVNVVKAARAGRLFFQYLTPSTPGNPAPSVDDAVRITMGDSSLSGFGDSATLLDPVGGSQTADTLGKP